MMSFLISRLRTDGGSIARAGSAAIKDDAREAGSEPDRYRLASLPAWTTKSRQALADETGASAVEFALVILPFLMLCLGILQFVLFHYTQQTLSDALYSTASSPEAELIAGNKPGYISKVCKKYAFSDSCENTTTGIKVELMRLDDLPTNTTAIVGNTFNSGSANDVLVLRAKMTVPQIVSFIPQMAATDSVIFRRR